MKNPNLLLDWDSIMGMVGLEPTTHGLTYYFTLL